MDQADDVFNANIERYIRLIQDAMRALGIVRDWLARLARETSQNMDESKQLDIQTLINKLTADVLRLETAERIFSHLPSVRPANQVVLLIQIMECCGQVKQEPDVYPRQGESTYASDMIAWVHEIVCVLYQHTGDARAMTEGNNFLNNWAITLESVDGILERCTRIQVYINSCVQLDDARELKAKFLEAIPLRGSAG